MEEKKPRVGVYVCHCGGNISDWVDVQKVVDTIKSEDIDVIVGKHLMFDCSDASQNEMIEDIKTQKLDRLVVAACSPKLHELTFRGTAKRAGLNPYMYYHASIREQSSWAHGDDKTEATEKALSHSRAAIAYVKLADPLQKIRTESTQTVLVIGGGIAGLRAAIDLAEKNIGVILVEKSPSLGGHVAKLSEVYPYGRKGSEIVRKLVAELMEKENVAVFTNASVESYKGYVGKFDVKIKVSPRYVIASSPRTDEAIRACPIELPDASEFGLVKRKALYMPLGMPVPNLPVIDMKNCTKCGQCVKICGKDSIDLEQKAEEIDVRVGAIIVATGFDSYQPKVGEFGYGVVNGVLTLPEVERLQELSVGRELEYRGKKINSIAFIYCVGSRQKTSGDEESSGLSSKSKPNEYCSRYCCNAAVTSANVLSRKFKGLTIYHLYRDIRTYGKNELMYETAGKEGSIFVRFDEDNPPVVDQGSDKCVLTVKSSLINNVPFELTVDMVVLVTGMVSRENSKLNELLALPVGSDGFYKEVHQKLRPVETNIVGLLIAGTAQAPKDIKETLSSGSAAASKAASFALKKELELEPFVATVEPALCEASKLCIKECPYGAIEMTTSSEGRIAASVNIAVCKGCGACVAVCPTEAIQLQGLTNHEIRAMIGALAR
jgi:heterodisulfide reductase subunit A2